MPSRTSESRARDPYVHAAAAYVVYGLVYLGSAWASLTPERMRPVGGLPWWSFFVLGGLLLVVVPLLLLQRSKWLARILALGPGAKALVLLYRQGTRVGAGEPAPAADWLFALVAIAAAVLLLRAGFGRPPRGRE